MKYRIGIDLGTASAAVVAVSLEGRNPGDVIWHHTRLFNEPVESTAAGLVPKKAARRLARQQRRQIDRRARRLRKISRLAPFLGLSSQDLTPHSGQGFTLLRKQAATEKVELKDLFLILMRLAKRRGYSGSFIDREESGQVQKGSEQLRLEMAQLAQSQGVPSVTLGEYLHHRHATGLSTYLKKDHPDNENPLFALRQMVLDEFHQIWETQATHYPVLSESREGRPIKEWFKEAIFYQAPLKSPAATVGNCLLERNLPRSPRAQMAAQEFRILKTLRNMRWGTRADAPALTDAQLQVIRPLFDEKAEVSFTAIYRALEQAGQADPQGRTLNLDRSAQGQTGLKGNTTLAAWRRLGLYDEWMALPPNHQVTVINLLADIGGPEVLCDPQWHTKQRKANATPGKNKGGMYRTFHPDVIKFIDKLRTHEQYDRFTKMRFEGGRMSYSIKALTRINAWLNLPVDEDGVVLQTGADQIDEHSAIEYLYPRTRTEERASSAKLPKPAPTGNDVVDVALRELHKVLSACFEELGCPPEQAIVELARDVGLGVEARNEMESRQRKREKQRKTVADTIEKKGYSPTGTNILRYELWQEQAHHCPYCPRTIGLTEALSGTDADIEHILPRSLTQIGHKKSEIVLAHSGCNSIKGNRTPHQAFGHDATRWGAVQMMVDVFKRAAAKDKSAAHGLNRKAYLLGLTDYEGQVLTDSSIAGFADRQLHHTSWIAKAAAVWLQDAIKDVWVSRGQFTSLLRRQWGLDTVIAQARFDEGYAAYVTGKPGATPEEITKEQFEKHRAQWEGRTVQDRSALTSLTLEKRTDHRHHAVDALVIALSDRSLLMRLGKQFKERAEQEARGSKQRYSRAVESPMTDVRNKALQMVRAAGASVQHLSHKPNRYSGGRFFQDTHYSIKKVPVGDGDYEEVLAKRVALSSLAKPTKKPTWKETLSSLQKILSPEIRRIVIDHITKRIDQGQSVKEALASPVPYTKYQANGQIWRVTIEGETGSDKAICVTHHSRQGEHKKWVLSDGYDHMEVHEIDGKPHAKLVRADEAIAPNRTHPPTLVAKYYKGDTIQDKQTRKLYVVKQLRAEGNGSLVMIPVVESRQVGNLTSKDGRKLVSGKSLLNFIALKDPLCRNTGSFSSKTRAS